MDLQDPESVEQTVLCRPGAVPIFPAPGSEQDKVKTLISPRSTEDCRYIGESYPEALASLSTLYSGLGVVTDLV